MRFSFFWQFAAAGVDLQLIVRFSGKMLALRKKLLPV